MSLILIYLAALLLCSCAAPIHDVNGTVRTYYMAAIEVNWDYAPSGWDNWRGVPLEESPTAAIFTVRGDDRIGRVYKKAIYREYTDATFATQKEQPAHLGMLGPVIRAEVGDEIRVVFRNLASRPYSVHPHGVFYGKNSEGALYADGVSDKGGAYVFPNETYTYVWKVPERAGPGPNDPSSILWQYHSHISEGKDTYSGLVGPLIIYRQGSLGANGIAVDVDREYVAFLFVTDENESWYLDENIKTYCYKPETVDPDDDDFVESNLMHSINGYVYANLDGFFMCDGEIVRWYVLALGTEVDLHTFHWHGQTLLMDGHRVDVVELLPATMRILDMGLDNPGNWALHCHVNDHMTAGMNVYYQVATADACSQGPQDWVKVRESIKHHA